MLFKEEKTRNEFWELIPKAKYLLTYINWLSFSLFKKEVVITGIYYQGGSGVHSQFRAFDLRTKDYYTQEQIDTILETINRHFVYDPKRPEMKSCIYHKSDQVLIDPEYHLHCQVWIE